MAITTNTPRILIVDDDVALLHALPQMLRIRLSSVQVDTAEEATQALVLIQQCDYDAIVSDIKMPGMDGIALLEKIRELRPETPTLLITGHGEHDLAIQALRGGAYDFIQKPIDRDYLVAALQRAIHAHQLHRQVQEQQIALSLHASSLERLVQKRTQELVEANAVKDKFLTIASHEIKAPLANARTMLHMLHEQVEKDAPKELVLHGLADMERSIMRTSVLVQDLLDTSLIESNMFALHRTRCDLVELCHRFLSEYTQGAGPDLSFDLLGGPIEAEVDEKRIFQVLLNLLSNARAHAPKGTPITITLQQEGYEATLAVHDQGRAIADDELPHLFEQFSHDADVGTQNASRLGLYVSRKIIERHGGRIDVQSVMGIGNTFTVVLPIYIKTSFEQSEQLGREEMLQTLLTPHTQAVWTVIPVR